MGLSGSKPPATCESQELLSAMDVNASVALGVGQDPALDITNLAADHDPKLLAEAKRIYKDSKPPFLADSGNCVAGAKTPVFIAKKFTPLVQDHPVEGLDEAKAFYMASRPPFVVRKTKKPRRRVLLAVQGGQSSAISTKAEVVYREWDSLNDYPTLDLDGKRVIVMGSPGGNPAGYRYRFWLGSKAGRDGEVIAYETIKTASGLTEHLSEADEGLDNEDDQDPQKGATVKEWYNYDGFRKAFDFTAIPPSRPSQFSLFSARQSIVPSEPSARKERPDRNLKPTKRARSATPPAQLGSRKGKAPDHAPKRTFHRTGYASDDCSGLSSLPHETPVPTPSINNRAAPSCETQDPQIQAPSSLPTLTLYKQTHTTLRARRDSSIIGHVPLRLLPCMTMSKLFKEIIAASRHQECDEPINCLMAMFDWKEEDDVFKRILIDKATEWSFEIFLEIIDGAPCWKDEGGKCSIAIEVVRP